MVQPLIERVQQQGDFGVMHRKGKRDHAKFAVAVLCFVQNSAATRLLDQYVQGVRTTQGLVKRRDRGGVAWFHDQLGLWEAYHKLSFNFLGLPRKSGPRLVALSDQEHSIDGNTDAIFVSRRGRIFDMESMQAELASRGIEVRTIPVNER